MKRSWTSQCAIPVEVHPHIKPRHACGFTLADKAQTHGSFKTISDTVIFSPLSGPRDQPGTV